MKPSHRSLRTLLLATLAGCGSPEDWPECGNEEEVTSLDDALEGGDFYVCGPLPDDGSDCAPVEDIDAATFFAENVGSTEDNGCYALLRAECGPEETRDDACCYILAVVGSACAGRPFVVEGQARVATLRAGLSPWSRTARSPVARSLATSSRTARSPSATHAPALPPPALPPAALPPTERATLARHWTDLALAEHASIASFARFGLDLLALGAPPELLAAAARAQAEEVVHARLAFGLASAYAGHPVAPGPLAVGGVVLGASPVEVARALAREGCVGETIAVAVAMAALEAATDPAVRRVLTRVVRDEARHAALAWRSARWLRATFLETAAPLDEALHEAVHDTRTMVRGPEPDGDPALLRAHGLLDTTKLRAVEHAAVSNILRPVMRRLAA